MSGTQGIASATALPFREAIAYFRGKTNTPTRHWTDVWRTAHARSFMVAGAATDALLNDFRTEITRALEQGTTLRDFRRGFNDIVARHGWEHTGTPGWRSRIIYETNLSMAYAAGRYAQMTEPDTLAVFPYWQYVHSRARNPRRQHQQWDGLVLRADDPFWRTNYPPNGWRCGCRVRPVSGRGLERMGRDGPDASPPLPTRPWTNPRTGQVHQVVEGIDPGFDYNPGEAWQGPPEIPGDAVRRPPPRGWPPAPPATDLGPAFRSWVNRMAEAGFRPDGSAQLAGELDEATIGGLAARGLYPRTTAIAMRSEDLRHLTRDVKAATGRSLTLAEIRRLPELLRKPEAVLLERATGHLLMVFSPRSAAEARSRKLAVHLDFVARVRPDPAPGGPPNPREAMTFNAIRSGGLVETIGLRDVNRYAVLSGAL